MSYARLSRSPRNFLHLRSTKLRSRVCDDSLPARQAASVVGVHISDDVITPEGKLDLLKMRPLARLRYQDNTTIESVFTMAADGPNTKRVTPVWKEGRAAKRCSARPNLAWAVGAL